MDSEHLVSVPPDSAISEAVDLMRRHAIRRLPVIGEDGRPQGFVSMGGLAAAQGQQSALADVSTTPPNV